MNGLSHKQARRFIHADLDGLLNDTQRLYLKTHLSGCEACRAESESLSTLTSRLQSEFHERWDAQDSPSQHVMANVHSQTRRIIMSNRINFGLRTLAGIAIVLVLGFGLKAVISQLRGNSTAGSANTAPDNSLPVISADAGDQLLAFTSAVENGNLDIYTMLPDGSELTNLTNNPAHDNNPIWSPDGKQIIFESDRTGFMQIFLMNPDGSNVIQLTNDEADHYLPLNVDGHTSPWSPDGSKLLYLQRAPGEETWTLYSIDISGANKTKIATGRISLSGISWSPDGRYIGYIPNDSTEATVSPPDSIYIVDADGKNPREIKKLIPQDEHSYGYQWSPNRATITFITNKNHSLDETVYEFDPETNTLLQKAAFSSRVLDWQKDVSLVMPAGKPETTFVWQRSDGTSNTLDWGAECWEFNFRRSFNGNFAISAYCPDNKSGVYWANSDGSTIKQLLDPLINDMISGIRDIVWSPDDKYIAFVIRSSEITYMYVLNVEESLKDPSVEPAKIAIGGGDLFFGPSWRPQP